MNYKFIDIPGWQDVASTVLNYAQSNTDLLEKKIFWNLLDPEKDQVLFDSVSKLLMPYNLSIRRMMLLIVDQESIPVHQDNNNSPVARINIPIKNCQGSFTNFYKSSKWEPTPTHLDNGFPYILHNEENCVLEDQIEVSSPVVMNVQAIHNVTTKNINRPRIMLSIQTDPDAVILLKE